MNFQRSRAAHPGIAGIVQISLLGCFLFTAVSMFAQGDIEVYQMRDSRSNRHAPRLHVDLRLKNAASFPGVTQYRIVVSKAIDDLGVDLINRTSAGAELYNPFRSAKLLHLNLVSPARRATVIAELSGTIELYVPQKDPSSRVLLDSFFKQPAGPVFSPQLAAAGVNLDAPIVTGSRREGDPARFIKLSYTDPNSRVAGFEFTDPIDGALKPGGTWISSRELPVVKRGFTFQSGLFDSAAVIVDLATAGSLVKVPFALYNIPLP